MTDFLNTLPTDEYDIDGTDRQLLNTMFKPDNTNISIFLSEFLPHVIYGILFLIFISFDLRKLVHTAIPYSRTSDFLTSLALTFVFVCSTFFIGMNFQ